MINKFKTSSELYNYLCSFSKDKEDLVLIRGSTAHGISTNFSDVDVEIYSSISKYPFYELCYVENFLVLLTIYFYTYEKGIKIETEKNIKVLKGVYNDKIDKIFKV